MERFNKLVWSEEFDNGIDPAVWGYEIGYIRNNELQIYTDDPKNAYTENSCLVIESIKTGDPDCPYTSASINTLGKQEFLYGRLEMRAKLPFGKGIWPAFWTLGVDINENPSTIPTNASRCPALMSCATAISATIFIFSASNGPKTVSKLM